MSIERDPHPSREQLAAFDAGQLSSVERAAIERHLTHCPACGRRVDTLPEDPFVALVRAAVGSPCHRPATHAVVVRELAPFAGVAEEPHPAGRRRWPWLMAGLLFMTGTVAGILAWSGSRPKPPSAEPPHPVENVSVTPADPLALATDEQMVRLRNQRRDQALAWLGENGRKERQRALVRGAAAPFDKYPGQIDGFHIILGPQWIDSRQAVLLAGHHGGFFVFPLNTEQAAALKVKGGTHLIRSCRNLGDRRRAAPRVLVSALQFEDGQRVDLSKKVSGSIAYEVCGPAIATDFAVRLGVYLDDGRRRLVLQWFKKRALEGRGTLRFTCPPLASRKVPLRGPVVLLADLCTSVDRSMLVESDAAAVLVEAVPPANPLRP